MAKKRPPNRATSSRSAQLSAPEPPRWRQVLLLASVAPMAAGVILFAASWFGAVWIGSATTQTVTGALLAFFGFTLANGVQGKWLLAGGWALLGVAVWLLVMPTAAVLRWIGGATGVAGMALVLLAFAERYRQIRAAA